MEEGHRAPEASEQDKEKEEMLEFLLQNPPDGRLTKNDIGKF